MLPPWAQVSAERRAHIERVAGLIGGWADVMAVAGAERARWLKAAYLHDALRDAQLPFADQLAHGPAAADRAAREGETDQGVLDAVRYHTVGYAGWDDVGRMLYLADFLEPGRSFAAEERRRLAQRVPLDRDAVLKEVVRWRIQWVMRSGWPLAPETVELWSALASR
jgi:HD domain-containing protein